MSRRARALTFLVAAVLCAALAAALAGGYGASVEQQLGELRPVLVATSQLPAREQITARTGSGRWRCGGCRIGSFRRPR